MKKLSLLLLVVAFVLGTGIFAQAQTPAPLVPKLTVEEYKANPDKVYVIMFTAVGCQPCRKAKQELLPELVQTFATNKYKGKVGVYTVDITRGFLEGVPFEWSEGVLLLPTFRVLHNKANLYTTSGYSLDKKETIKKNILETVDSKM